MAVTNTRTTKLQQQFDPAAHVTVVTCDKDDKANMLIVERVMSIVHTDKGIQLQTETGETVFVVWDNIKYFMSRATDV